MFRIYVIMSSNTIYTVNNIPLVCYILINKREVGVEILHMSKVGVEILHMSKVGVEILHKSKVGVEILHMSRFS